MEAIHRTGRLLRQLVRVSCRYPGVTVALSLLLAVVGIAYTLHRLTFETTTRALLPQNAGYEPRRVRQTRARDRFRHDQARAIRAGYV